MTSHRRLAAIGLLAVFAVTFADETPPMPWGEGRAGFQVRLRGDGVPHMLGDVPLVAEFRSVGEHPLASNALIEATAYLLVAQGQRVLFTDKLALQRQPDWPEQLASGQAVSLGRFDAGPLAAWPYRPGGEAPGGHPQPPAGDPGKPLGEWLRHGSAVVTLVLWLPMEDGGLLLRSAALAESVRVPVLAALPEAAAAVFVARVVDGFRQDAAAGKAAHAMAVELGDPMVEPLLALAADDTLGDHSRMWLATALIDLGDPRVVPVLLTMIEQHPATRSVIAYHGPKLRQAALDEALAVFARQAEGPELTAWALRGFATFRGELPQAMLDRALTNDDPRLRATAVEVISRCPHVTNEARLLAALRDPHPRVRGAAATAVARLNLKAPAVLDGLAAALADADDQARAQLCDALGTLTGQPRPYEPEADEAARLATLRHWQQARGIAGP